MCHSLLLLTASLTPTTFLAFLLHFTPCSPSLSLSPSDALGLILSGFDVRKKVSVMFYELSPQRGGSRGEGGEGETGRD